MSELPPPDLLDHGNRLRRFVLATILGVAAAVATYRFTWRTFHPERQVTTGGYELVTMATMLAGALVFGATMKIMAVLARRKEQPVPRATIR